MSMLMRGKWMKTEKSINSITINSSKCDTCSLSWDLKTIIKAITLHGPPEKKKLSRFSFSLVRWLAGTKKAQREDHFWAASPVASHLRRRANKKKPNNQPRFLRQQCEWSGSVLQCERNQDITIIYFMFVQSWDSSDCERAPTNGRSFFVEMKAK